MWLYYTLKVEVFTDTNFGKFASFGQLWHINALYNFNFQKFICKISKHWKNLLTCSRCSQKGKKCNLPGFKWSCHFQKQNKISLGHILPKINMNIFRRILYSQKINAFELYNWLHSQVLKVPEDVEHNKYLGNFQDF